MIVIMAEKENAAKSIAEALLKNYTKLDDGFYSGYDNGEEVVVVYSQGHCVELLEPEDIDEKYKKWTLSELPIPFNDNILAVKSEKKALIKKIKSYLNNATLIINAGDSGREGELIQRWILKYANINNIEVLRLWTSSLTKKSIKDAYSEALKDRIQKKPNKYEALDNLYASARARAIFDKYAGYNYSRLISLSQTDGVTVNYGRCKSPLTHAIIERDLEIENFVKRPYSYISATLNINNAELKAVVVDDNWKRKEFENEEAALNELSLLKDNAQIIEINKELKVESPPKPFDILTIQKEMSKKYNYDADYTLAICQSLYDKYKILSYPRTDSRYLTNDLKAEIPNILDNLDFGEFSEIVKKAKERTIPAKYFNDKKVVDHHALIPMGEDGLMEYNYKKLNNQEKNVFKEIVLNFLSLFFDSKRYELTEIHLLSGEEKLKLKVKNIVEKGFSSILEKDVDEEEIEEINLGSITEGSILKIAKSEVINTETKPKNHFTTATLLDYMKIYNIGTGATRDSLLKELTERKGKNKECAIERNGKYFISTSFGREMDKLIPNELKSIEFLSQIDTKLLSIEKGELSFYKFIKEMEDDFANFYKAMAGNKQVKLKNSVERKSLGVCPLCGSPVYENSKAYGCSGYKEGCKFTIWKTICGKKIPITSVKKLIAGKETGLIKGFKSKSGKTFDARLRLKNDGTVEIFFDSTN